MFGLLLTAILVPIGSPSIATTQAPIGSVQVDDPPGVYVHFKPQSGEGFDWTLRSIVPEASEESSGPALDGAALTGFERALGGTFEYRPATPDRSPGGLFAEGSGDLEDLQQVLNGVLLAPQPLHSALAREAVEVSVSGPLEPFLETFSASLLIHRLDSTPFERTEQDAREAISKILNALGGKQHWSSLLEIQTTTRLDVVLGGQQTVLERIHVRQFNPPSTVVRQLPEGPSQRIQELSPIAMVQTQGTIRTQHPPARLASTWRGETASLVRLMSGLAHEGPLGARLEESGHLVVFDDNGDLARIEPDELGRPSIISQLLASPTPPSRTTITAWSDNPLPRPTHYNIEGPLSLSAEVTDWRVRAKVETRTAPAQDAGPPQHAGSSEQ